MHISQYGALVGLLASAAEASPAHMPIVRSDEKEVRSTGLCSSDLTKSWTNEVFYSGVVQAATAAADAINLGLAFTEAALEGSIDVSCDADFLFSPTVRVDLGGIKAYLNVALGATGGVSESINIFSDLGLSLAVPSLIEFDLDVGFALDLVFSTSAALDLETIFNVQFPTGCYIEINVLTQEIVNQDLTGLVVETLPQSISSLISLEEDVDLNVALRLRAGLGISSEIDIIGFDLGAGAEVALWANLFDYTTTFSQGASGVGCTASESFALTAGVAVEVDIEIESLDLSLAPSVIVTLASSPAQTVDIAFGEGSSQLWPWSFGYDSSSSSISGDISGDISGSSSISGDISGSISGSSSSGSSSDSSISVSILPLPSATGSASGSSSGSSSSGSSSGDDSSSDSSAASQGEQTTIVIQATQVHTVLSCAATITNCPAATATSEIAALQSSLGSSAVQPVIVTSIIAEYTTICPVTAAQGVSSSVAASMSSAIVTTTVSGSASYYLPSATPSAVSATDAVGATPITSLPAGMTTSHIVETHTYTMTSCAAAVKNCPSTYTQQVVTSVVVSYTTICPVTATQTQGASSSVATASASTSTTVVTIPAISSTVTMVPLPTPSTSTETIPSTVQAPPPTVVITESPVTATAPATAAPVKSTSAAAAVKPSGAGAYSETPLYPTGSSASYPSGVAAPSGIITSAPVPTTASSSSGQANPSSIVTAGASKASFGLLAALAPLFFALM